MANKKAERRNADAATTAPGSTTTPDVAMQTAAAKKHWYSRKAT